MSVFMVHNLIFSRLPGTAWIYEPGPGVGNLGTVSRAFQNFGSEEPLLKRKIDSHWPTIDE